MITCPYCDLDLVIQNGVAMSCSCTDYGQERIVEKAEASEWRRERDLRTQQERELRRKERRNRVASKAQ